MIRALVILVALAGAAEASEWKLAVPAGFTEADAGVVAQQLAQLRGVEATVGAEAKAYLSQDQKTQLTILHWSLKGMHGGKSGLESLNRGVTEGARQQATGKGTDSAAFEGNELVADQVETVNGIRIRQHRRFAIDAGGITHMVSAMCAGAEVNATCEQAIGGMQLALPDEVAPDSQTRGGTDTDIAYQIGRITGVVVVLVIVLVFLWRRSKKS